MGMVPRASAEAAPRPAPPDWTTRAPTTLIPGAMRCMLRTGGRVARPLSTVEIRQYGEAVDVDPWAYPAGPSKAVQALRGSP
jgi:hypothetical protein